MQCNHVSARSYPPNANHNVNYLRSGDVPAAQMSLGCYSIADALKMKVGVFIVYTRNFTTNIKEAWNFTCVVETNVSQLQITLVSGPFMEASAQQAVKAPLQTLAGTCSLQG